MKKICAIFLIVVILCVVLAGCREANTVNRNLSKDADYFKCERRITVYNARTDKVIMEAEGYFSISNSASSELVVTFKVSEDTYKKNYIYLTENTLYVVEDITGTHTDPYHYELVFDTTLIPRITTDKREVNGIGN